ncbi:MAG: hypothetical protein KGO48_03005, partial [Alphaproteobacteria bacterium]|nr:hypothetical protein [Alphaproteobacteria bacterium]
AGRILRPVDRLRDSAVVVGRMAAVADHPREPAAEENRMAEVVDRRAVAGVAGAAVTATGTGDSHPINNDGPGMGPSALSWDDIAIIKRCRIRRQPFLRGEIRRDK